MKNFNISHFEYAFYGIFKADWKRLADKGQKIAAIKEFRNAALRKGSPLPDLTFVTHMVDKYMSKRGKK